MSRQNTWMHLLYGFLLLPAVIITPLAGVMIAGESPFPYLEFPPQTTSVEQSSFSAAAFIIILLFIVSTTWPFWRRLAGAEWTPETETSARPFPWWGWLAAGGLVLFWILAWTRFSWFEPFQRLTFFPLWFCMIVLLNAFAFWLSGRCLLKDRPVFWGLLFPVSAMFWWVFEYLNRFLNNWHYAGIGDLESGAYFLEASLAFSTVLPAVLSMRFILLQFPGFFKGYDNFPAMPWLTSKGLWSALGLFSMASLAGIGWQPKVTYPLVWIAPGLLWISFQKWNGYTNPLLKKSSEGYLALVWSSAVAALLCGFFWEMWNFYSEAKWIYNVPGVERFHLFEMPLLGYAGYLPFGVICALVSNSLLNMYKWDGDIIEEDIQGRHNDSPQRAG